MLKARHLPPEWVLIYAWSPLAVFEISGNGHMESAAALFALLALHWSGRRIRLAAVAIASAALTQWYAFALIPTVVVAAGARRWRGLINGVAWLVGWSVLLTLPYLWINKHLALATIAANVRAHAASLPIFNASLFAIAAAWFGTHVALALAVAVVGAVIIVTAARRADPLRAAFLIIGALLLVLPHLQPWFLLWLLPLLVFFPEVPWLYFAAAVPLAYLLPQHSALIWVEYVPLFALLAWQGTRLLRPARKSCET